LLFFFLLLVCVVVQDDRDLLMRVVFVFVFVFVFNVGRLFVFVDGITIGLSMVVSIPSKKSKRVSQNTAPSTSNCDDNASINIPRTNSLVSSSKGSSDNIPKTYSIVSTSIRSATVDYNCANSSVCSLGVRVSGGIAFFCFFFFLFVTVVGAEGLASKTIVPSYSVRKISLSILS